MPVTYDDPRFTYDNPSLTYDGTWIAPGLTGAQGASSGELTALVTPRRQLAGSPDPAFGTLALRLVHLVTLTGGQSAGTGGVTRKTLQPLAGDQPPSTGQLTARVSYKQALAGSVPSGETGGLSERIAYKRTVGGAQPESTGGIAARPYHITRITLTGYQAISEIITYDEPGIHYDEPSLTYDGSIEAGRLWWWVKHSCLLVGLQPPPTAETVWFWNPYVWAEYFLSITERPETSQYQFSLDADDHTVTYDVDDGALHDACIYTHQIATEDHQIAYDTDEAGLHDDVIYKVSGIRVYTPPPSGVRQKA